MKMKDVRTKLEGILTANGVGFTASERVATEIIELMTDKVVEDLERGGFDVERDGEVITCQAQ